jgi:two-component system, chemotaxis family, sensor kinase CheA
VAIDLSQFYQVFFEETDEHLANMESLLLGLDMANPDIEQLNAIFRAAHSIKGSAGTFGFTDMAQVTHILENLLDRIRKGELALRDEMIDAFLDAGDVLKTMLAGHKGDGQVDPAAVDATCARLKSLTGGSGSAAPSAGPAAPEPPLVPGTGLAPASTAATGYEIHFVLEGDPEGTRDMCDGVLGELAEFGSVRLLAVPDTEGQPYRVELLGEADDEALRGMLEFVARSDSIRILPLGGGLSADSADGAYGLFSDEVAQPAVEEAYGLFADVAPAASAGGQGGEQGDDQAGEAYGLFDEMPAPAPSPAVPVDADDGSYGFFVDVPAAATAVLAADAATAPVALEGDGFGLFVDVPAPVAADLPAAPVATPVAEAPAEKREVAAKPAGKASGGDATIRVGVEKVDQLINLVGELVITQAMLLQSASGVDPVQFERLHSGLTQLERNSRDLQEAVMSIRMMPISVVFSRFPRVVRELSQKLGKKVELKLVGESTELDKSLIERISDPLTHLVRNSLDHGIEMPDARADKGKQPVGTITLRAYHQSGNIVIEVGDDGAGLNRQRILAKAKERGFQVHDQMTDQEVWLLIFEAGFSTAEQVTEVSGRGVGMDVVKRNINAMGGRVEIESMTGIGTRMTVRLPLTLAILDGMSIAIGHETYIVPLGYVVESLQAESGMIKSISGVKRLLFVRGEYLPVIALHELFGIPGAVTALERGIMVIIEADGTKAALFVDALMGQQQVVIKSLEANYRKVSGVSGATIMGDGHVALILDVAVLAGMAKSAMPAAA